MSFRQDVKALQGESLELRRVLGQLNQDADPRGVTYYVDAVDGKAGNDGLSWDRPLLTMDGAFDKLTSGDTIRFRGKIVEQLTTPAQVFDVTVIGDANKPRHADATPADVNGRSHGASWQAPASPTADTALVTVQQQGWAFVNILFDGHSDSPAVQLFRDGGSGNDERDAGHATFVGCKFTGSQEGIEDSGGCGHVLVSGCEFTANTTGIGHITGAGIGQAGLRWLVERCRFTGNTNDIDVPAQEMNVRECTFTGVVDLAGGVGSSIVGPHNVFSDTYDDTTYKPGTSDIWAGNYTTAGITTANPA